MANFSHTYFTNRFICLFKRCVVFVASDLGYAEELVL